MHADRRARAGLGVQLLQMPRCGHASAAGGRFPDVILPGLADLPARRVRGTGVGPWAVRGNVVFYKMFL